MSSQRLLTFILAAIPRLLSQQDRDPTSLSYGSFDRDFWQYKIRDFSSAILQQSSLTLALLYTHNFPGNPYFRNKKIKEWAKASLFFLTKIQLADGSFNEYYPNEHSYPATSFNLYSGTKVYQLLKLDQPLLLKSFLKSAQWLKDHQETEALNQSAASIPGFYRLLKLTKQPWLKKHLVRQLDWLLAQQTNEGWFREYGGLDAGYLSTTLEFLADYWQETKDKNVWQAIEKTVNVLQYLIHPDGTIGGQYTSRHTTYLCLGGLSIITSKLSLAQAILQKVIAAPSPFWESLDDRYLTHNLFHSLLTAHIVLPTKLTASGRLPCENNHLHYFSEAGILTHKTDNYYLVVGAKKGGVLYFWQNNKPFCANLGWEIYLPNGQVATTNWLSSWKINFENQELKLSGYFMQPSVRKPTASYHLLLRLGSFLLGNHLIKFLKKNLIFQAKTTPIFFERKIKLDKKVQINDDIQSSYPISKIFPAGNFSKRHISSSHFAQPMDFLTPNQPIFKNIKTVKWVKFLP